MKLAAYIRVSTEEQAEHGHSITQQQERTRAYCALHGHELIGVYVDEGISAARPLRDRPAGKNLLNRLVFGHFDGVVITRLDRLFRSALDGLMFFADVADKRGIAVHSISELIDTSTPSGKFSLTLQLAAAQFERDMAVARARETNTSLREQGRVYGGVPYGCIRAASPGALHAAEPRQLHLLRDPDLWPTRETIYELRVTDKMSYGAIVESLRAQRIASPAGAKGWSKSTLRNLVESHATLLHLPLAEQGSAAHSTSIETGVSQGDEL